jgi:hypothetical protein
LRDNPLSTSAPEPNRNQHGQSTVQRARIPDTAAPVDNPTKYDAKQPRAAGLYIPQSRQIREVPTRSARGSAIQLTKEIKDSAGGNSVSDRPPGENKTVEFDLSGINVLKRDFGDPSQINGANSIWTRNSPHINYLR